jgi:hypothetical protein
MTEYGPLELPSGRKIHFKSPTGLDRVAVLKLTKVGPEEMLSGAMLFDYYMQAKCVTKIDDCPVPLGSYKNLLDAWETKDILFYQSVFNEMFSLTDEIQDKTKEIARFLLSGEIS